MVGRKMTAENDLDEFLSLVGSDNVPIYHFYIFPSDLIWGIRIEDDRPKKDDDPWRLVWMWQHKNPSLSSNAALHEIGEEIRAKKAKKIIHRGTPNHWSGGEAV